MGRYTLNINGTLHEVDAASDTPLLWILRDSLKLIGTRFDCGVGQCSACTVLINGVPARACMTRVSGVGHRQVTTIGGPDAQGHAVAGAD